MAEAVPNAKAANGHPISQDKPNGHTPEDSTKVAHPNGSQESPKLPSEPSKARHPRPKKPNYGHIHRKPLPLEAHPLPAFHPTNPLSLLQLAYTFLSQLLAPPTSHPEDRYTGYFHAASRCVHVTDPAHIRALWEMGFFGNGTLSRSEPSWLEREEARRAMKKAGAGVGGGTAEEATRKRREDRRAFKLERARVEAEKVRRQRDVEQGRAEAEEKEEEDEEQAVEGGDVRQHSVEQGSTNGDVEITSRQAELNATTQGRVPDAELVASAVPEINVTCDKGTDITPTDIIHEEDDGDIKAQPAPIEKQEFLQLTLEEAFFLSYGLGVLSIIPSPSSRPPSLSSSLPSDAPLLDQPRASQSNLDLLTLFAQHATFPPSVPSALPDPSNGFLLNYVVYHHFRSLGWVVRPGTKFSCDYLLYNRGPVFSHAEFAVIILPSYSDPYWATDEGQKRREKEGEGREKKDWWWLHCVNRVQSQVKKSLVMCYVEVPPPLAIGEGETGRSVGKLLKRYSVREFVVRRWLMNRSR